VSHLGKSEIGHHTYFSLLNAWLRNQAFQFHNLSRISFFSFFRLTALKKTTYIAFALLDEPVSIFSQPQSQLT